jgi:hypothetical protein
MVLVSNAIMHLTPEIAIFWHRPGANMQCEVQYSLVEGGVKKSKAPDE